jgi:hypothetical protein
MAWWDETCDWREQVGLPKAAPKGERRGHARIKTSVRLAVRETDKLVAEGIIQSPSIWKV